MALIKLARSYLTWGMVMQSGLERGFRYFKVSPIKAFRDICHVFVDNVFATGRYTPSEISFALSIPLLIVGIHAASAAS